MAESDEWATVETVDDGVESATMYSGLGPKGVQQNIFEKIMELASVINLWYVILAAVSIYYLWQRLSPSLGSNSSASSSHQTLNPQEILEKQEAQEKARKRMQELYDQKAREHAIKQKEKEEIMRQNKIQNLEKYGTVLGRSAKTLVTESSPQQNETLPKKKIEKPKLRPEYNPLMGGNSSCFRPARRGGGAGGG